MTLIELSEALKVPPRQIRFMISEGCMPPANGTGRGADAYDETHLIKGRRYINLHKLGMKPQAIKVLMAFDEAIPIYQNLGVELRIDPSADISKIDQEYLISQISDALRAYLKRDQL